LTLSEINYNPLEPTATELAALPTVTKDDFEFIELTNISATSIDLAGVRFDQGITYVFNSDPLNTSILALDPGARCLLVRNKTAFELRYGTGLPIAGVYQGSLSNSGETIRAFDAAGSILAFFEYNDSGSWPGRPDGDGSSLEITRQSGLPDPAYDDSDAWRAVSNSTVPRQEPAWNRETMSLSMKCSVTPIRPRATRSNCSILPPRRLVLPAGT
jgi:hypothetical protein